MNGHYLDKVVTDAETDIQIEIFLIQKAVYYNSLLARSQMNKVSIQEYHWE